MDAQQHLFDTPTYEQFRTLILERSGLHFPDKRRADLERGVAQAMAHSACADVQSYYQLLAGKPTDSPEWETLIGQVTVGETYFFRDRGQFEALRGHLLPELIAQKRQTVRQLRIWSAGCASGEEPYSLAILLRELLPDLSDWNITILATDINREALQKARRGLYGEWSFREAGWQNLRDRYFTRRGKEWEISSQVRQMVSFAYLNLREDPYPAIANNTVAFDLVLCRNVAIYFSAELVQYVVNRMYEALVDGGWLLVGYAEPSPATFASFEAHNFPGTILYRKSERPPRREPVPPPAVARAAEIAPRREPVPPPAVAKAAEIVPPCELARPAEVAEKAAEIAPRPAPPAPAPPAAAPPDLPAQARLLVDTGRTAEALELLYRLLEQDPQCAWACFMIGKIRANSGLWEEARRWCQQAVQLDPLLAEAHFLLSLIHSQENDREQALAAMKRVLYLERNAILGHFCLANLYLEGGKEARARKSLQNAAALLEKMPPEAAVPWSDGMTAGRLLYTVRQQLQELIPARARDVQLVQRNRL